MRIEAIAASADYRRLADIDGIGVDLRYATADNFVGRILYGEFDCAWLHTDAASALEKSVAWLHTARPDLRLLVLDAMRPQRVQEQLWAALQGTELLIYLADPLHGSIHSFGMALDVTLIDADGRALDMGTPFDDLTALSHPALEDGFLAAGDLAEAQIAHRRQLRAAMTAGGWRGIHTEWWHFDCGDRVQVRAQYERIL
jgi:D-alanyl-D-alanine dipeptidase